MFFLFAITLFFLSISFFTMSHLLESELPSKNGMKLFDFWYNEAKIAMPHSYFNFMLSTVSPESKPSCRALCLSNHTEKFFHFFTNANSPKIRHISHCPFVSMYFLWPLLHRAVRIEGKVVRRMKGDEDFVRCPSVNHQITLAAVEFQSVPAKNLSEIEQMKSIVKETLERDGKLSCPSFWIGAEVEPETIEFIKLQPDYASDRLKFYNPVCLTGKKIDPVTTQTGDDGWIFERLTP